MRPKGVLVIVGIVLLAFVGLTFVTGMLTTPPVLVGAVVGIGAVALGLMGNEQPLAERSFDPVRSRRRWVALAAALGAMGVVAAIVALTVAQGEARGHAFSHWIVGVIALALFAVLALLWHPQPGTGAAATRIGVLALLAVGAFGSFLESLGGSGYDAANIEHRIEALAALHGIALPFAALGLSAVPVGALVGGVVLVTWGVRRRRDVAGGPSG